MGIRISRVSLCRLTAQVILVAAVSMRGQRRLWLRGSISSGASRPLNGTEGADTPFWSPDSRKVGFIAGNKLKRINVDGRGVPQTLGDASPRGGWWNRDDIILYAPNVLGPLARIGALGGDPVPVTKRLQPLQTARRVTVFPSLIAAASPISRWGRSTHGLSIWRHSIRPTRREADGCRCRWLYTVPPLMVALREPEHPARATHRCR